MGSDPRLEQRYVTLLQRVIPFAAVAVFQQQTTLLLTQQRQLAHIAVEAIGQGQQQALELCQQALDRRGVEIALIERQVQPQVIAGVADCGQREVGVGATGIGAGIQVLRTVQHRDFHRGVLEHEQAVEQWLALG
ncbi:hypothetical protein D3C81_709540 [compost metagenome]